MGNIITYVQTEMRPMTQKPFSAVDSLVLTELAYVNFGVAVPGFGFFKKPVRLGALYRAELFDAMLGPAPVSKEKDIYGVDNRRALLFAAAASPRFRDLRLRFFSDDFDAVREQQFSAVTFTLPDGSAFIAFRGTDMSLVGWKEDFNMAYISPVPSQLAAAIYTEAVGKALPGRLRLGGHSKGGNLAVYAAMTCRPALQSRILEVYNHDGPGFKTSVLDTPGYRAIEKRVRKVLPESSIVGMLLNDSRKFTVVQSSRLGLMQHDAFSWEVENGDFVCTDHLTDGAVYMHKTMDQWLETLPDEKRRLLVEVLFQIIERTDIQSLTDLTDAWGKSALALLDSYRNLDTDTRQMVSQVIRSFLKMSLQNLRRVRANGKPEKRLPSPSRP